MKARARLPLLLIGVALVLSPMAILTLLSRLRGGTMALLATTMIGLSTAGAALIIASTRGLRPGRPASDAPWLRQALLNLAIVPVLYIALRLGMTAFRGGSLLVSLLSALPMALMFAGFGVLGQSVKRRGVSRHCAKCGYEQSDPAHDHPQDHPLCPECGSDWQRPGGVVLGERTVRPWLIALAVLMIISPFAVTLGPMAGVMTSQATLSLLPTESLIREIADAPGGFVMDEWAVLSKRTLTPAQVERFAVGLLDRRDRKMYLDRDSELWLQKQEAAGSLDASTRTRLFRDSVLVWIDAPGVARAGSTVSLGLGTIVRGGQMGGPGSPIPHLLFAGFTTPDGPGQGRSAAPGMAIGFGRLTGFVKIIEGTGHPGPTANVTIPTTGPLRVTADYWLVYAPPGSLGQTITWNPDGSPVIPPAAIWAEKRTIDAQIAVSP